MGLIKEPIGVDLVIGPSTLTDDDRKMISEAIANYKRTGNMPTKTPKTEISKQKTTLRTPKMNTFV